MGKRDEIIAECEVCGRGNPLTIKEYKGTLYCQECMKAAKKLDKAKEKCN